MIIMVVRWVIGVSKWGQGVHIGVNSYDTLLERERKKP
jgi:hypothetical protein